MFAKGKCFCYLLVCCLVNEVLQEPLWLLGITKFEVKTAEA